jgi:WD40 repeat protein
MVACDDGRIKSYSTTTGENLGELQGHEDAVQAVAFDHAGMYLLSCGSDNTFRLWA